MQQRRYAQLDTPIIGGIHIFPRFVKPIELRAYRMARGLTQAELAAQIGVGQGSISRWEQGIGLPHDRSQRRLAQVLKIRRSR